MWRLIVPRPNHRCIGGFQPGGGRSPARDHGLEFGERLPDDRRRVALAGSAPEQAPAGSILHGVAEGGVPIRRIAELIGRHLDVPTAAIAPERAAEHFGRLSAFFAADVPTSSALTREPPNRRPTGPGLVDDLDEGHYFHGPSNPCGDPAAGLLSGASGPGAGVARWGCGVVRSWSGRRR